MRRTTAPSTAARLHRVLTALALGYFVALLGLLALVYGPGEGFWPVTLFLFGPRWVVAAPLLVLALAALFLDRRLMLVLILASLVTAGPLFGFNVPGRRLLRSTASADGPGLRLATWNVGTAELDARRLRVFLEYVEPDVLVLQECERSVLAEPGEWNTHYEDGMCLLSRFPIRRVESRDRSDMWDMAGSGAIVRGTLDTPLGPVRVTNLHLETPREGIEALLESPGPGSVDVLVAKNEQRDIEARLARSWVDQSSGPSLVAGDFNTPAESNLFREHWRGFRDCHADSAWGFGFTKRTRRIGIRIDHVLAGPGWTCVESHVEDGLGGDHSPLVVLLRPPPPDG